jgi:hypothetical protein
MMKGKSGSMAILLAASLVGAAPSFAQDSLTGKTSFGFQGVVTGNMLNAASLRGWTANKFGWEGNLLYSHVKVNVNDMSLKGDLWGVEAKGLYALIERTNSKMYVGAKFAYLPYELKYDGRKVVDGHLLQPGVLAGAEFCIPSLPEVGINFEVGYSYIKSDNTIVGNDLEMKYDGINAGVGIHYYF